MTRFLEFVARIVARPSSSSSLSDKISMNTGSSDVGHNSVSKVKVEERSSEDIYPACP